jgi:hypothetical protein
MIRYDPSPDLGAENCLNSASDVNLVLRKLVEFVQGGHCERSLVQLVYCG